jgi:hypothetical protein
VDKTTLQESLLSAFLINNIRTIKSRRNGLGMWHARETGEVLTGFGWGYLREGTT